MCPETITPNECVGLLLFDTWKNNPRTRLLTRCTRKRLQEELFALGWQKRRNQIREGRITPEIGEDTIVAAATEEVDIEETTIIEEAGIGETTMIEEEEEEKEETGIMIEGTTVATTDEMEDILAEEGEITMTAEAGMGAVAGMKTDELERVTTIDELEQVMTIEEDTTIKEATMIKDAMMIEEATTIEEVPTKIKGEEKAGTDTKTEELLSKKKERTRYPT